MSLKRDIWAGYGFIMPAILLFLALIAYPFGYTVWLSFRNFNWFTHANQFIGLHNYFSALQSGTFWDALGNDLIWTVGSMVGQMVIALFLALFLNNTIKGIGVYRALFILPWVLPTVVTAIAWRWLYNAQWGDFTYILWKLHLTSSRVPFLAMTRDAMPSVILVNVWRDFPLMMVGFLAAMQSIPKELYESATVDGASNAVKLFRITLPLMRQITLVLVLFRTIWVFNFFDLIWLLTGGGPASATLTLPILVYQRSFGEYRFGSAAAIAVLMFLMLMLLTSVYFRLIRDEKT